MSMKRNLQNGAKVADAAIETVKRSVMRETQSDQRSSKSVKMTAEQVFLACVYKHLDPQYKNVLNVTVKKAFTELGFTPEKFWEIANKLVYHPTLNTDHYRIMSFRTRNPYCFQWVPIEFRKRKDDREVQAGTKVDLGNSLSELAKYLPKDAR